GRRSRRGGRDQPPPRRGPQRQPRRGAGAAGGGRRERRRVGPRARHRVQARRHAEPRPGRLRGDPPRDRERLRDPEHGGTGGGAALREQGDRPRRRDPAPGAASSAPRDLPGGRVPHDQPARERRQGGDGDPRQEPGVPRSRQDGHDEQGEGRLVRRVLDGVRGRVLGGLRRPAAPRLGRGGRGDRAASVDQLDEGGPPGQAGDGVPPPTTDRGGAHRSGDGSVGALRPGGRAGRAVPGRHRSRAGGLPRRPCGPRRRARGARRRARRPRRPRRLRALRRPRRAPRRTRGAPREARASTRRRRASQRSPGRRATPAATPTAAAAGSSLVPATGHPRGHASGGRTPALLTSGASKERGLTSEPMPAVRSTSAVVGVGGEGAATAGPWRASSRQRSSSTACPGPSSAGAPVRRGERMIDLAIVLAFVTYSVASGFASRRRASRDLSEYFLAGRSLEGWRAGVSMAATQYAADTPMLVAGLVAVGGVFSLWRLWSYGLAFLMMGFLLGRAWRRAGVLTD